MRLQKRKNYLNKIKDTLGINKMPTYNYSCKTCGHLFEVEKTIDDETKIRCPMCKSRKVKKLINIPTVIYKDDGFTQYRKKEE